MFISESLLIEVVCYLLVLHLYYVLPILHYIELKLPIPTCTCSARWDPSTFTWSKRYDEALKDLHWPTLELRRHFLSLCQIYKIVHNLACISFFKYFAFKTVNTRSHKLSLLCKSSKLNSFRYSFFINAPFIWNKLPFEIVSLSSYSNFKNKLMNFML